VQEWLRTWDSLTVAFRLLGFDLDATSAECLGLAIYGGPPPSLEECQARSSFATTTAEAFLARSPPPTQRPPCEAWITHVRKAAEWCQAHVPQLQCLAQQFDPSLTGQRLALEPAFATWLHSFDAGYGPHRLLYDEWDPELGTDCPDVLTTTAMLIESPQDALQWIGRNNMSQAYIWGPRNPQYQACMWTTLSTIWATAPHFRLHLLYQSSIAQYFGHWAAGSVAGGPSLTEVWKRPAGHAVYQGECQGGCAWPPH
jgi:hypothetical protein